MVCRYVERNPVRAGLSSRAEDWPWSSARRHVARLRSAPPFELAPWPIALPPGELEACRLAVTRGRPFGRFSWQLRIAHQLGLDATLRPRERPRRSTPTPPTCDRS
jgi:putative transposase